MSGEVGCPEDGNLVYEFSLSTQKSERLISSAKLSPLVSEMEEDQSELWALKSPRMMVSDEVKKGEMEGEKPGGQEVRGGM